VGRKTVPNTTVHERQCKRLRYDTIRKFNVEYY